MEFFTQKYMNLLSGRLRNFRQTSDRTFNFSCPFCGDSERQKNKARGYIYGDKSSYHCHNCGQGYSFSSFIKVMDYGLYGEYLKDKLGTNPQAPIPKKLAKKSLFREPTLIDELEPVSALGPNHIAKKYVQGRKIPEKYYSELFYCPEFKKFVNSVIPDKFESVDRDEGRLVIPFISQEGRLFGFQGRSFKPDSKLRYITIIFDERYPKYYGLHRVDFSKTFLILEGPLDTTFLRNAIACAGSDIHTSLYHLNADISNAIVVYDNEPRAREIVSKMERCIQDGLRVCLWPEHIESKDINDMILKDGLNPSEIEYIIATNSYSGLEARVRFSKWKKI